MSSEKTPMYWKIQYLLSRIACSTQEVFSLEDSSSECWLIADKNLRISLVLSVFPAPLSPLKEEEEMICTVPVASEETLWLAIQTLHYWRSGRLGWLEVMVKWSQNTPLNFLNLTSREKHKLSLGFIPLLRQITRHWLCMCTHLGGNKELSECKQLANTSHDHVKVTTKGWQWLGIKTKLRIKMGKFGIYCSNLR